jgi:hypothetical protein
MRGAGRGQSGGTPGIGAKDKNQIAREGNGHTNKHKRGGVLQVAWIARTSIAARGRRVWGGQLHATTTESTHRAEASKDTLVPRR